MWGKNLLINFLAAILVGTACVWVGASVGATLAFLLARYVLRKIVHEKSQKYRIFSAIDTATETEGLKLTLMLRLSPVIPFNALNYFMGITGVKFKDYVIGNIGMIPGTAVYVYFGTSISSLTSLAGETDEANSEKT